MPEVTLRRHVGWVCVALGLGASPSVLADPAKATALFEEGLALVDAKKLDEGCAKFEASLVLDRQLGALLNVADCRERRGHLVEAHALYEEAVALAVAQAKTGRETFARERATAMLSKLGVILLRVSEPALPQLSIKVATYKLARDLPRATWSKPFVVEPGKLIVELSAPAHHPLRLERDIVAGASLTIDVPGALEPLAIRRSEPGTSRSRLPYIVAGAGGALLLGSVGLALHAKSSYDDALAGAGPGIDTEIDRAQRRADIATGLAIAGGIALGVGVYLYVRDRRTPVALTPTGQRDTVGVQLVGAF